MVPVPDDDNSTAFIAGNAYFRAPLLQCLFFSPRSFQLLPTKFAGKTVQFVGFPMAIMSN
jgi:hypothetical protein